MQETIECYCEKQEKTVDCGKTWSCGNICAGLKSCGNCECQELCHPGECPDCLNEPSVGETCFCGQAMMKTLSPNGKERKSCKEPKLACQGICNQTMDCGHPCKKICHDGPHDCEQMIMKDCRCDYNEFEVKCIERHIPVLCETICRKKMTCKVHKCRIVCCIAKRGEDLQDLHVCVQLCGKELGCEKHPCSRFCHNGPCPPCDVMTNQTLSCACGQHVINPPVKCGTEIPDCHNTCNKILECGHPCYAKCHYGDCAPCAEIIDKHCACGKVLMKNVTCSRNVFCMNICTNKFDNCSHKCNQMCHLNDCNVIVKKRVNELIECSKLRLDQEHLGCGNLCEKVRKVCGHPCQYYCHPEVACPQTPCQYVSRINCKCGNRQAWFDCGATDQLVYKELPCDAQCKNLQRFKSLYDQGSKKVYYAGTLVKYARNNLLYVQKLEANLQELIAKGHSKLDYKFEKKQMDKVRFLQILLPKHYGLEVAYCRFGNYVIVTVKNLPDS